MDELTLWELAACIDGVNFNNNPEASITAPSDAEFEAMLADWEHLGATPQ